MNDNIMGNKKLNIKKIQKRLQKIMKKSRKEERIEDLKKAGGKNHEIRYAENNI